MGRAGTLIEAIASREALREAVLPAALRAAEDAARERLSNARAAERRAKAQGQLKPVRAAREECEKAQEALGETTARLHRESRLAAALLLPEPDSLAKMQARLRPGDALVLYCLLAVEEPSVALVITRDAARLATLAHSGALDRACTALLPGAEPWIDEAALAGAQRAFVEPLALAKSVTRVFVCPQGRLGTLPWSLLLPGRSVASVASGTVLGLLGAMGEGRGEGVLAVGDPAAGGAFVPLPGAREEAKTVGSTTLLGAEATKPAFFAALGGQERWHAVHFACHGLIDAERPMNSFLALAPSTADDGRLMALDLLRGGLPSDLVVMSACETGKGRIFLAEGILGLTQACITAGAPRVIASLWPVDDEATLALMTRFYDLWKTQPTATALRGAQEFVASHEAWRHPRFWAAWQLWGRAD